MTHLAPRTAFPVRDSIRPVLQTPDIIKESDALSAGSAAVGAHAVLCRAPAAMDRASVAGAAAVSLASRHPVVSRYYELGARLGRGCFSDVYKSVRRSDKQLVAVKVVEKDSLDAETTKLLENELVILRAVAEHPGIVSLLDSIETESHMYFVLEYIDGGPLLDQIVARGSFSENDARVTLRATLMTLGYLAELGCVHRDIKPENILVDNKSDLWPVKLTDFGLSAKMQPNEVLHAAMGSPIFVAPEVLSDQGYDCACDMWSLGVLTYIVLVGYPPWPIYDDPNRLIKAIVNGAYAFPEREWSCVSDDAKDVVRRMLEVDPKKRITPAEALEHRWFSVIQSTSALPNKQLGGFNARRKMRAVINTVRTTVGFMNLISRPGPGMPDKSAQHDTVDDYSDEQPTLRARKSLVLSTNSEEEASAGQTSSDEGGQPSVQGRAKAMLAELQRANSNSSGESPFLATGSTTGRRRGLPELEKLNLGGLEWG